MSLGGRGPGCGQSPHQQQARELDLEATPRRGARHAAHWWERKVGSADRRPGKTYLESLILSEPSGTTDWNDSCGQGVGAMDRSNQAGVMEAARLSQPRDLAGK